MASLMEKSLKSSTSALKLSSRYADHIYNRVDPFADLMSTGEGVS